MAFSIATSVPSVGARPHKSLQHQAAFPRLTASPLGPPAARPPTTRAVQVHAKPKRISDDAEPEATRFEKETTEVVIRCLTARAVQHVLLQLQHVDGYSAAWLNKFSATHPPLDGDKFISDLMLTPPAVVVDPHGSSHVISPTQLATGVLTVRSELAQHVAKALPTAMAAGNVSVMRRHLEEHTYVSGSSQDAPRPSYRDYRRRNSKWQRLARG